MGLQIHFYKGLKEKKIRRSRKRHHKRVTVWPHREGRVVPAWLVEGPRMRACWHTGVTRSGVRGESSPCRDSQAPVCTRVRQGLADRQVSRPCPTTMLWDVSGRPRLLHVKSCPRHLTPVVPPVVTSSACLPHLSSAARSWGSHRPCRVTGQGGFSSRGGRGRGTVGGSPLALPWDSHHS